MVGGRIAVVGKAGVESGWRNTGCRNCEVSLSGNWRHNIKLGTQHKNWLPKFRGAKTLKGAVENTTCENNTSIKQRFLTRRLVTSNVTSIRSVITNYCPSPAFRPAHSVAEHGGPCRKLPFTCGHLAKFGCSCMSYHVAMCWGRKQLRTLPKVAGPCSTEKQASSL